MADPALTARAGDVVLVRATVRANRGETRDKMRVEFKNGDPLPLRSVEIVKTERYVIARGDFVRVHMSNGAEDVAEVKAVIMDVDPPQIVVKHERERTLRIFNLHDAQRVEDDGLD